MHLDVHHRLLIGVSIDRAGVFVLKVADHCKVPAPGIDCGIDVSFQSREKLAFAVALGGHAVVAQVATVYFDPGLRFAFFDRGDGTAPTHGSPLKRCVPGCAFVSVGVLRDDALRVCSGIWLAHAGNNIALSNTIPSLSIMHAPY